MTKYLSLLVGGALACLGIFLKGWEAIMQYQAGQVGYIAVFAIFVGIVVLVVLKMWGVWSRYNALKSSIEEEQYDGTRSKH